MDKNNLIQKLQSGGSVVQLEEYQPGQYLEKALSDAIEYSRYNRNFKEEQRQFDERMQVEKDRVSVARQQSLDNKLFNNAQLKLKDEELKRNDFIEFGSKMPPQAQLAYAKANNMPPDMIEYAENLLNSWNKYQQDYRTLKTSPTTETDDWKQFKDRNISNFSMFKSFAPNLEANVNAEHQGRMNKDLLVNMIGSSPNFVEQMGKLGIDVSKWKDLDPVQATATLKQLPSYISTGMAGRKLDIEGKKLDIADEQLTQNVLAEMLKYSTAAFQSGVQYDPAQANEFLGSMNTIMNEMFKGREIETDLGLGEDDDTTVTLDDKDLEEAAEREARTGTLISAKGTEEPFEFEKGSDYRVEITDALGKRSARTIKGGNAANIQKQKGWDITKADKIIKPLKRGKPTMERGDKVKILGKEKVYTYVGYDNVPKEGIDETRGRKIKSSYLHAFTGGLKVLHFKDAEGKRYVFTPREVEKTTFIEAKEGAQPEQPAVRVADKPKEETKVPLSPSGSVAASGMEGRGDAQWDEFKSQVDSVQNAIDSLLQEEFSQQQELDENE
jgi:hypothetical protein